MAACCRAQQHSTHLCAPLAQVLAELRNLQAYREPLVGKASQILAIGLSSRKNMCIHPKASRKQRLNLSATRVPDSPPAAQVSEEGSRESVDAGCRRLTAAWVRDKRKVSSAQGQDAEDEQCDFFEDLERAGTGAVVPPGVYTVRRGELRGERPHHLLTPLLPPPNSCRTCARLGASSAGAPTF